MTPCARVAPATRIGTALLVVLTFAAPVGCRSTGGVLPGFVGVPERLERSDDVALPLDTASREHLLDFMAASGNKHFLAEGQIDPGARRTSEREYGGILDRLSASPPPTTDDLDEGSPFRLLFGDARIVLIHDARVGPTETDFVDLATFDAVGFVLDDWVFAFYLRRLEPVDVDGHEGVIAWHLLPEVPAVGDSGARVYTALVIFSSTFAIPTEAR